MITGRPAALAVDLGSLSEVPGIVVLGHYGSERWESGVLTAPSPPAGLATARAQLPALLASAGAPQGTWVEDKGRAIAVHTRRADDPTSPLRCSANRWPRSPCAPGLSWSQAEW